ncbi:MAG: transposase [Chloroflexi bacterium]|nr:transposase [Chloroflexota bacterium]
MKRRKWDPKTKAMIVVQGLKGKPVAEICLEHQISQTQYYQWRDQFLSNAHQIFADNEKKNELLTKENVHLRKIIGDLTVELKKTEEWLT